MSSKKHTWGAITVVATTALTVIVSLIPFDGVSALAAGTSTSTPTSTGTSATSGPSSTGTPTVSGTPAPSASAAVTSSATSITLPNAAAIRADGAPGQSASLNVLAASSCAGSTPCSWANLTHMRVAGSPAVAGVTTPNFLTSGNVVISVASGVTPGTTATFAYTIFDTAGNHSTNTITFTIGHAPVTPNIGKTVWTGHAISFDLLSTAKCNDLTSPCPASAVSHIFIGADPLNPQTKATVTASGTVTISVGAHQYPFGRAHIPYIVVDKYGRSQGLLVVSYNDSYNPTSRYIFNNPLGNYRQQQSIDQAITDLTNHAPKGSTIEMITYTLDGQDLTYALVNAYKRGVNVRVLQGNGIISGNVPYLQQNLGTNQSANSFYHICRAACRSGVAGVPHTKVFAVTSAGRARNIVVSASSNYSYGGSGFQWFDGYELVNNAAAYAGFDHIFQESRLNPTYSTSHRPSDWTGLNYQVNSSIMYTYPRIVTSLSQMAAGHTWPACSSTVTSNCYRTAPLLAGSYYDWLEQALAQVSCGADTAHGYGRNGRTLVRVTVRALQGARGYDIAHMLGLLAKAGCDVRVITTQPSTDAVKALQAANIWVGDMTWRWRYQICSSDDSTGYTVNTYCWLPGLYTHMHSLAVSGGFNGQQQKLVWTGSESWATDAYYNDEQVVRLAGSAFFNSYMNVFNFNWGHYVHPPGQMPQGNPPGLPPGTQLPYS